jgi:hypothetical protein
MVQNKDIDTETSLNGNEEVKEEHTKIKTNGNLSEEDISDAEDEEDYTKHLLILPTLEKAVAERNTSLISQQLFNFYTAIENRKEYQKIKQGLLESYLQVSAIKQEVVLDIIDNVDNKSKCNGRNSITIENVIELEQHHEEKNEVEHEMEKTKKFKIFCQKAKIGLLISLSMFLRKYYSIHCFQFQNMNQKYLISFLYVAAVKYFLKDENLENCTI